MKKLEFETSKGRFVVSDERYYLNNEFCIKTAYLNGVKQFEFKKFIEFSRITEEQASEIVENPTSDGFYAIYGTFEGGNMWYCLKDKPIESLHSLLKSKGIHLFKNPVPLLHHSRLEAEEKTFYNPYIFKL